MLRFSRCLLRQPLLVQPNTMYPIIGPYCAQNSRNLRRLGGSYNNTVTLVSSRSYIFLPSSFREARHDFQLWWDKYRKRRKINVKLKIQSKKMKETWRSAKSRVLRRVPSRKAMSIKYKRWHNRLKKLTSTSVVNVTEYSRDHWFDENGHPLTSRDEAGRFVNPWSSESTSGSHPIWHFLSWRFQRLFSEALWQTTTNSNSSTTLPLSMRPVAADFTTDDDDNTIRFTWIGHSTCMVQMDGYHIITDPQLSARAGPTQLPLPFNGVKRHVPPACQIEDLPSTIDVCLLSHDHYDHLDRKTCSLLKERVRCWVVPLGMKDWLIEKCNIQEQQIHELEWWESTKIEKKNKNTPPLTITCAPTQHWSCRTMWDRNHRLWCSFAVDSGTNNFYFGGDTGYHPTFPLFRIIGERLGPFDLAALPIGAYKPRFFMSDSHVNPHEAVKIHEQIRSTKSVGIHWGTFRLSDEGDDEPRQQLQDATTANKKKFVDFTTIPLGSSINVKGGRRNLK